MRENWHKLSPKQRQTIYREAPPDLKKELETHAWYIHLARDKQCPPEGRWFCWLLRTGRGWGKTRTGAEYIIDRVRQGYMRIALVGQTKADVRDTMIELGPSSILQCSSPDIYPGMPVYEPSKRRLTWKKTGATAVSFSGDEPGQLRGPEHDTAWLDEPAKFKYPQETWDMMEFGMRSSPDPRVVATTTPRPIPFIKRLIADPMTVDVTGSSYENRANLSAAYIERIIGKYEGTHLGRQEIHGEILDDIEGALWTRELLEMGRLAEHPSLVRIAVGVDPAASTGDTGIVVVGICPWQDEWHGFTLDDQTLHGSPAQWGLQAVAAYHRWKADVMVGEVNNGGDMVEHVIRSVKGGASVNYKCVRASRGKWTRAEPVAALYEQGRAHQVGFFADLEDQLCSWVPGEDSPDRLDAMVWAYHELMLQEEEADELIVYDEGLTISPF